MGDGILGDFEQAVLLAILAEGDGAFALEVRRRIEEDEGRAISRGAFYTTLERLEAKGMVAWVSEQPVNARRREVQRLFSVTPQGRQALWSTRHHLEARWSRLRDALEES